MEYRDVVGVLGEGSSILGGEKVGRDVVGVLGKGSSILGGEKVGRDVGGCLLGYREMEMCVRKEEK